MTESIRYTRIGKEDINFGSGTFEARLADGRVVILNKVDLGAILLGETNTFYETGTWTPSVGGTAVYDNQDGYYTKIGNVVTVSCNLGIDTIGTGSASGISGLPYTIKTGTRFVAPVYWDSLTTNVVALVVRGLTTTANLWSALVADDNLTLRNVLGDGSSIFFTGSYLAED